MRVAVLRDVPATELTSRLPGRFRGAPLPLDASSGPFTVLILETGDRVVTSAVLSRGLSKAELELSSDQRLLVCGYNFTEEVRATIGAAGSLWIAERDFHWTDERYHRIRQPKPHDDGGGP